MQNTAPTRILVIEDEPDLREAIVSFLCMEKFDAFGAGTLSEAERWMARHHFDILMLDLGLPDGDGIEWLSARNDLGNRGVIIATARGAAHDRLLGLKAGSDAYLMKPVQLEELAIVAHRLALRTRSAVRQWQLDTLSWQLSDPEGASVKLTGSETRLLGYVCRRPGTVIPREELIAGLGYDPLTYDPRRLEILIRRLRNKARDQLCSALPLESVYGKGFSFTAAVSVSP